MILRRVQLPVGAPIFNVGCNQIIRFYILDGIRVINGRLGESYIGWPSDIEIAGCSIPPSCSKFILQN